jgi:hypothetical protein
MFRVLVIAMLQSLLAMLQSYLKAVIQAIARKKEKLDALNKPESQKMYDPSYLAEKRREAVEQEEKTVFDIMQRIGEVKKIIKEQQEYWTSLFWRTFALYRPPEKVPVNPELLLSYEKIAQQIADYTVFSNVMLSEDIGRLRYLSELQIMPADDFKKTLEDASASGNVAIIYLGGLVAGSRTWPTAEERASVVVAVKNAQENLNLPQRTESLDLLQQCFETVLDIESAYQHLTRGTEDVRAQVRQYTEIRRQREALKAEESAQAEAEKNKTRADLEKRIVSGIF